MKDLEINGTNNFMRIFQLPDSYPRDYCFGGGIPVTFNMVDWFNPVSPEMMEAFDLEKHRKLIKEFIRGKTYYKLGVKYIAITDYGDAFLIT